MLHKPKSKETITKGNKKKMGSNVITSFSTAAIFLFYFQYFGLGMRTDVVVLQIIGYFRNKFVSLNSPLQISWLINHVWNEKADLESLICSLVCEFGPVSSHQSLLFSSEKQAFLKLLLFKFNDIWKLPFTVPGE